MGVINITPDSFSDGGEYLDSSTASKRATEHINSGADVLDIGAQSTKPKAAIIGYEQEILRLKSVLKAVRTSNPKALISVDTFHSRVAEYCLKNGANWINDVTGGRHDPEIFKVVAEYNCPYILTHSRGDSSSMDSLTSYNDVTNDVREGLLRRTEKAIYSGVPKENIIWDPGLGFAKTNDQNVLLIKNINKICSENFPVLLGPSRKRFIGEILKEPNPKLRDWGTAAIACRCVQDKVTMIRVHEVAPIYQTIKVASKIF